MGLLDLLAYLKRTVEACFTGTRHRTSATIDAPLGVGGGVSINHKESEIAVPSDLQAIYNKETHATTALLNAGATYTGGWVDLAATGGTEPIFKNLIGSTTSDQISAANGVSIEQSPDQTNISARTQMTTWLEGAGNRVSSWEARVVARYARIVYTNGGVNQTRFNLRMFASVQ